MQQTPKTSSFHTAASLRRELNLRAAVFARQHGLPVELSPGRTPSVLFAATRAGHHGNFPRPSYRRICTDADWAKRLEKPHTAWRRAWPRADWQWRELDCTVSSDALLMSVLCYPHLLASTRCALLLGVNSNDRPQFGVMPRLECQRNLIDTTEVDAQIGDLLIEAKLTEADFQSAPQARLERFVNWRDVFDPDDLPRSASGALTGYQLIRGALAAHAGGGRFCVVCDARRLDLREQWLAVIRAVRRYELRCRLTLLTWQELSAAAPRALQSWLSEKYGILPAPDRQD